jgi:hypothetical protein
MIGDGNGVPRGANLTSGETINNNPNPFTATSPEFPQPSYNKSGVRHPSFSLINPGRNTEEYARLDSARTSLFREKCILYLPNEVKTPYDDRKGKHVLGLVTNPKESLDLRSRRERNESAQGLIRSKNDEEKGSGRGKGNRREETDGLAIWVGLQRWTWGMGKTCCGCGGNDEETGGYRKGNGKGRSVQILVPATVLASCSDYGSTNNEKKKIHPHPAWRNHRADNSFDDEAFAKRLRAANRELTGNLFSFSARTLSGIRFVRRSGCCRKITMNNANSTDDVNNSPSSTRRTAFAEKDSTYTTARPHPSETHLLKLYKNPANGRKKYIVVAWARRAATTHSTDFAPYPSPEISKDVPMMNLVYAFSKVRILGVMTVLIGVSVAAALGWIFLGRVADKNASRGEDESKMMGPSERVGSGMAMGVLLLLVEASAFGAWLAFS